MDLGVKRMPAVHGNTRVVCIIGNPVRHSLTPIMQNAAFAASRLDYVYVLLPSSCGLRAANGLAPRVNAPLKYGPVKSRLKVLFGRLWSEYLQLDNNLYSP